jgi:hypothetical protein
LSGCSRLKLPPPFQERSALMISLEILDPIPNG